VGAGNAVLAGGLVVAMLFINLSHFRFVEYSIVVVVEVVVPLGKREGHADRRRSDCRSSMATHSYVIKCHLQITFVRAPQLATMDKQPTSNIAPSAPMVKLNALPA